LTCPVLSAIKNLHHRWSFEVGCSRFGTPESLSFGLMFRVQVKLKVMGHFLGKWTPNGAMFAFVVG
jgi:hypothetical protein